MLSAFIAGLKDRTIAFELLKEKDYTSFEDAAQDALVLDLARSILDEERMAELMEIREDLYSKEQMKADMFQHNTNIIEQLIAEKKELLREIVSDKEDQGAQWSDDDKQDEDYGNDGKDAGRM